MVSYKTSIAQAAKTKQHAQEAAGDLGTTGLLAKTTDVLIHKLQQWADGLLVERIHPLGPVGFYPDKSASLKAPQVMGNQALLLPEFFCDISGRQPARAQKLDNAPAHLASEGFKKELMRPIKVNALHFFTIF